MANPPVSVAPPAPVAQPAQPVPNLVPAGPAPQVAPIQALPAAQLQAGGPPPLPQVNSPQGLMRAANSEANQENLENTIAGAGQAQAAQNDADLAKQQAAEEAPIIAEQRKRALERTQAFAAAKQQLDQSTAKMMNDYQDVLADMKKYSTPYKSQWDAAGVSRVQGTIGMILAGFGSGLAHQENPAFARLNQLAQFGVSEQKRAYEAAQARGQMVQNAYGMAREKFGDDKMAVNATYDNQLEDLKQQTAMVANRFSAPKAQVGANALIAKINQEQAKLRGETTNRALQLSAHALATEVEQQRVSMALNNQAQDQQLPDVLGTIPKHAVGPIQKLMWGTNELVDQINYIQRLIDTPGIDKSQIVDSLNQQGPFFKAMIDFMGVSPRFAQMEGGIIKDLSPGKWKTALGSVGLGDFSDIREKLQSVKNTARRLSASELKGLGLAPNPVSPLYKDWVEEEAAKSGR